MEKNKKSLEVSIKGADDLTKYKKLSEDKLKNDALITVNKEIDTLKDNMTSVDSQLKELKSTIKNSRIIAACDGTVTFLDDINEGDIIQAGKQLCNIIPTSGKLKASLYIPESEISKVKVGQKTECIFDALPFDEYGKITGTISAISADVITNEKSGVKYYVAQAELSVLTLKDNKGNVKKVKNGMVLEAKVISGSKKVIVWILEKFNFMN